MDTTTTTSVFGSARTETKAKGKDEKQLIVVTDREVSGFSETLRRVIELRQKLADIEGRLKMDESLVKETGKMQYLELWKLQGRHNSSFRLGSEAGDEMLLIVSDRYKIVDSDRYAALNKAFPGAVEKAEEYSFDPVILERNFEALERAIGGADLPVEDKEKFAFIRCAAETAKRVC